MEMSSYFLKFIIFGLFIFKTECQGAQLMNPEEPIRIINILINGADYKSANDAFFYGMWSRYTPLSYLTQVGNIGIFDSNCYNQHNIVSRQTKRINLIYYVCLDPLNGKITQNLDFIDDLQLEHHIEVPIDPLQFEFQWYFFQIASWPLIQQFQIIILQYLNQIFFQELQISYPFYDKDLILTFGGGAELIQGTGSQKFSYFPGVIHLIEPEIFTIDPLEKEVFAYSKSSCEIGCVTNSQTLVSSSNFIKGNQKISYSSQNANCDYFHLAGWIKINQIVGQEFLYKAIKLTTNSQNSKLTNDNLSPFCLFYYISEKGNKIIITTYSFDFPSVTLDFSQNRFLKTLEFDMNNNIYLWHYISIISQLDTLKIEITFYQGFENYTFQIQVSVRHFHVINYQVQIGNILGVLDNYIDLISYNVQFSNCKKKSFQQKCHYSCLVCDGPSETDCVTCQTNQNRVYQPVLGKCICPHYSVDQTECITLETQNLLIAPTNTQECPYGYFNVNQECFQCPQSINFQQIDCLECLNNPNNWKNMLYCQTYLVSQNQETYKQFTEEETHYYTKIQYFTFDGAELNYCETCTSSCLNEDCLFNAMQNRQQLKLYQKSGPCYGCTTNICDKNCEICQNKICWACYLPYYLTADKKSCKICQIKNCIYCFEFLLNDLSKATLYQTFKRFYSSDDSPIKTGCALCQEGFNYDFISEKCIFGIPNIKNCLRSYINLQGIEVCTLSGIDDFNIAPEIINCEIYISNCEQCVLTPTQVKKCVLCADGYVASVWNGHCEPILRKFAKKSIQGDYLLYDHWVQLIQSFMMKFLPNNYFYPKPILQFYLAEFPLSCIDGYMPNRFYRCAKYCDSNCLVCEEQNNEFYCKQCPVNYFGIQGISQFEGKCEKCPQLCFACEQRNPEEIKSINPYFIINSENLIYTNKCWKAIADDNVFVDQQFQIAKYCFDGICQQNLIKQIDIFCDNADIIFDDFSDTYYQNSISTVFCNEMGIKNFELSLFIDIQNITNDQDCYPKLYVPQIATNLKELIFSLQTTAVVIKGSDRNIWYREIQIAGFDSVSLINFTQAVDTYSWITILNNQPINLKIENSLFTSFLGPQQVLRLDAPTMNNFVLKNVTLINLNLNNIVFFQYQSNLKEDIIEIEQFTIQNCVFENVTLFSFLEHNQGIKISKFYIRNSNFSETILIQYNKNSSNINTIDIIFIEECRFLYSSLIQQGKRILNITNLTLINNTFENSIIIESQNTIRINQASISRNIFQLSFLFKSKLLSILELEKITYTFQSFYFSKNSFLESKILHIYHQEDILLENKVTLSNFTHESLNNLGIKDYFIYDIQCSNLLLNQITIQDSINLSYFRIYQTKTVFFSNILFWNTQQKQKISIGQSCQEQQNIYATLFFVQGIGQIAIQNVSLINLYIIDIPFIQIESDILFQTSNIENITISQLTYSNNLMLKRSQDYISSMFAVYSAKQLLINMEEINFKQNFFHQLNDDSSDSTSGLVYINSKVSTLIIKNLTCISNGLTNSSNSFLYFNVFNLRMEIITVFNNNYVSDEIWSQFYNFAQISHSQIIMEQLMIINQGGAFFIISETIIINNCVLNKVRALSNAAFNILTQGQGIVRLNKVSISQASAGLSQTIQMIGCIFINSKNSKLDLEISNTYFEEVYNRLGSAIFTINPSLMKNKIKLSNITVINCFSLLNQMIKIEFSQIQANLNTFLINKLNFSQSVSGFINYLDRIQFPSEEEIKSMLSDNALINLQYCSVSLIECSFSGILFQPSFKLNYITSLKMVDLIISDIETLYPFQIGMISPTQTGKNSIILTRTTFQNITQIQYDNKELKLNKFIRFNIQNCQIQDIEAFDTVKQNQGLNEMILLFNLNSQISGSFIQMTTLGNMTNLLIRELNLFNNNCQFCFDGLIKISTSQLPLIKIQEFNCYNNYVKRFGCLQITSDKLYEYNGNRIIIKNSVFFRNNGSAGVGIFLNSILFILEKSIFLRNFGKEKGGAIYVQNIQNTFLIKRVMIINNQANSGGGIYLAGQNKLTKSNFKSSFLQFNTAILHSNNLVETPDHLDLLINNKEFQSITQTIENQSIQTLQLKPYRCLIQGKLISTKQLLIPSAQRIVNYQLFDLKEKKYLSYIDQFSLALKNSRNEILEGDSQDYCKLMKKLIIKDNSQVATVEEGSIFYNLSQTRFDLSDISVRINPKIQDTTQQQLELNCNSENFAYPFSFQIDVKPFLCQLGEYYIDEGCQICDPVLGFYSVTYNTTKCSTFDVNKFMNITSNQIQLKQGYWRPHYQSDLIEMCFKNTKWCLGGWSVNDNLCYAGHIGGLCEECDIYNIRGLGRYHKLSGTTCQICSASYSWLSFLLVTFWSISSVLVTLKSLQNSNRLFLKLKLQTKFFEIIFKQSQDFQSILLKMMLNYLWIFSVILTFNINFSFSLTFIDQASKPTYSMAINLDCLLNEIGNTQLVYIRIITILFFIMIQILIISIGQKFISMKSKESYDYSIISNAVIYLLVSNQASIVTMFGSLLAIRNISGIDYIQGNVSLKFYDQSHLNWIYYFILPGLCIFGVFFPFITFYILAQGKSKLNQYRFRRHLCYLYNEYVGGKYFWEQIKIWKRSIIIIILIYFENSISTKAFLISSTLLIYQHLAIKHKPYIINSLNTYDVQSGQIVSLSVFLAALKYTSEQTEQSLLYQNIEIISIILQLLIFGLCLWLCYYFIIAIMRVYAKKYDLMILTILFDVAKKLKNDSKIAQYLNKFIINKKQRQEQLQSNYDKLREFLLLTSKFQLEQLKNLSPLRSKRHIRLLTEMDTQRILLQSKSAFSPKELK